MAKHYEIRRTPGGVVATVVEDGTSRNLPHLVYHSPDGFEFGYGGSGPADLARSIVGEFAGVTNPPARIYQDFKWKFIAPLSGDGPHVISSDEVAEWLEDQPLALR